MENNENNNQQPKKNFFQRIPPFLYPVMGYIALALVIIIGIVIIIMGTAGVAEAVKNGVSDFTERLGNLFTLQGWASDDEVAMKNEKRYYETLEEVREEYKEKYGVEINTTLITATLFYGRTLGDWIVDIDCDSDDCDPNSSSDGVTEEEFVDQISDADFFKKARSHIKTLANYMIIKVEETNECGASNSTTTIPETAQELAEETAWNRVGGSSKQITNIYAYQGDISDPDSCPYEDVTDKYITQYTNSFEKQQLMTAYNRAESACENDETSANCLRQQQLFQNLYNQKYSIWSDKGIVDGNFGSMNNISFVCGSPYHQGSTTQNGVTTSYTGCSELPSYTSRYIVDDQREGVYYYKLMTKYKGFLGIESDDSFISQYYASAVKNSRGEIDEERVHEIVNEIYDLYDAVVDKQSFYGADGDFANWKQCNEEWSNDPLGYSANVCYIGCALTSLAIQIARSGVPVNIPNFNPGTFIQAMKDNGLIAPNGEIKSWDVSSIAPGFVFSGRSDSYVSREEIRQLLNQGYYIIVQVKQKPATHFVAISGMEGNTVLMNDPASDATDLYSKYSGIYGYRIFRVE